MPLRDAYRRTGADLPFGDPQGAHGTGFEGYFWRVTHAASGTVIVVLAGISRDRGGAAWGTVGLAVHPGGVVLDAVVDEAYAAPHGIGFVASDGGGHSVTADPARLHVSFGARATLSLAISDERPWPRRRFGALGPAQSVPGLSQYWHPHLLHATAIGYLELDGVRINLDGASIYGEKNWGSGGFPPTWWWGQAHGFAEPQTCVAFAGGRAGLGAVQTIATSLVVAHPGGVLGFVRPLMPMRIDVGRDGWRLRARGPRYEVMVEGEANGSAPHLLPVPIPRDRVHVPAGAAQHLAGVLTVTLRQGRRTLWRDRSTLAGLEHGAVAQAVRDRSRQRSPSGAAADPHILVARASQR